MKKHIVIYLISVTILLSLTILVIYLPRVMHVKNTAIGKIIHLTPELSKKLEWGEKGNAPGHFLNPNNIAIDSQNNVYISDFGNGRVQKFDCNGKFMTMWYSPGVDSKKESVTYGMAVDKDRMVYRLDYTQRKIYKYDSNGKFIICWGEIGKKDGQLLHPYFKPYRDRFDATRMLSPTSITVDKFGKIYVTDMDRQCIYKYSNSGNYLETISLADKVSEDCMPDGIAIDKNNNIYIVDIMSKTLFLLNQSGKILRQWILPMKNKPGNLMKYYVFIDKNNLIYVATFNRELFVYSETGRLIGRYDNIAGETENVTGIAINSNNELYLSEMNSNKIIKYSALYK